MCAISAHVGLLKDHKAFRELAISSLNAQMKKRTRVTSVAPDTVRLRPSAKLSRCI